MPRVDFYVLDRAGEAARRQFACRLAEKAYRLQHTVHIRIGDDAAARELDDLLWTFRDGSFVPHECAAAGAPVPEAPVTIGAAVPLSRPPDLLINLSDDVPEDQPVSERIAEIVDADDASRRSSRRRYARYRELGHTLETHKL